MPNVERRHRALPGGHPPCPHEEISTMRCPNTTICFLKVLRQGYLLAICSPCGSVNVLGIVIFGPSPSSLMVVTQRTVNAPCSWAPVLKALLQTFDRLLERRSAYTQCGVDAIQDKSDDTTRKLLWNSGSIFVGHLTRIDKSLAG